MKLEMLRRLREELLLQQVDDAAVVITTKRSFLPEEDELYINPRFRKKDEITANINTDKVVEKTEKNIEQALTNSIKYGNYNSKLIEESLFVAIVMDRRRYEEICMELRDYSTEEILNEDILNKETLGLMDDVVMIQPCMINCYKNPNNREDHKEYAAVEPVAYAHFNDFYNQIQELGYKIEIIGSKEEIGKHNKPIDSLVDYVMNNDYYDKNELHFGYSTNILVTADLENTNKKGISRVKNRK